MNKYILAFIICFMPMTDCAGDYICFDTEGVITRKVYSKGRTYSQRVDCVKTPRETIKSLTRYNRYIDGKIVELSQEEKDVIIASELKVQEDAKEASIDNLNISIEQLIKALESKSIITKTEIIEKVKEDEGLIIKEVSIEVSKWEY